MQRRVVRVQLALAVRGRRVLQQLKRIVDLVRIQSECRSMINVHF